MDGFKFVAVTRKYKKCPKCGASWETTDIYQELHDEIITIGCNKCGWVKKVDENNKEVK
ncbi:MULTISPECIES: hypothetical protein [unclassified Clostridium]|uniref:hypothetical protein n=1 Tax=unclassified Clostridium TaxID=2614128 RepID=UPI00207A3F45|nr:MULTISPECIES: hypothetical protein [unclassified Clostridium]